MIFSGISNTTRFLFLIGVILFEIAAPPFVEIFLESKIFFEILNTTILIAIIFALNQNTRYVLVSSLLSIPLVLSIWLTWIPGTIGLEPVGLIFGILFFMYTAIHILKYILSCEKVTLEVILGSIAVYLMFGIIWTICYGLVETISPGSFNFGSHNNPPDSYTFIYFSFVTLTTLGFGDISPATSIAQALTIVEALIGQIYLVVVIAWLVGMFISEKSLKIKQPPTP